MKPVSFYEGQHREAHSRPSKGSAKYCTKRKGPHAFALVKEWETITLIASKYIQKGYKGTVPSIHIHRIFICESCGKKKRELEYKSGVKL